MNDYRSNLTAPDLLPAFPNAEPFKVNGHLTYHDRDFDTQCGYLSPDEAAILYNVVGEFGGFASLGRGTVDTTWVEIGSHTGWSGAHIAKAGVGLVAIEPQLVRLDFYLRTRDNLERARVFDRIQPIPMLSEVYFCCGGREAFAGAFIDGDHDHPKPTWDAQMVLPRLRERAVVVFHDFVGQPVRDAVGWLAGQGFRFRVYNTAQMMAVCWRGEWEPPEHVPDPSRDWEAIRASHTDFDYGGES